MLKKFIQKCWACDFCTCYLIAKEWKAYFPGLLWIIVFFLFLLGALYCYNNEKNEIGAALIGAMGAVLTSSVFTLPNEIKKYKETLSLNKRHEAYSALCGVLNELINPLNLLQDENRPDEEELIEKTNLAGEKFENIFNANSLYFSDEIRKLLLKISTEIYVIGTILPNIPSARKEFLDSLEKVNKYIYDVDKIVRENLGIK